MFLLSVLAGSMERCLQRPFSGSFCCPSLWAWKCVQPPRHSVSAAVSLGPRLKNAKGAAEKSGPAYQDLCQKCFSPQVICYSLGPVHCYFKEACREMKGKKNSCGSSDIWEYWHVIRMENPHHLHSAPKEFTDACAHRKCHYCCPNTRNPSRQ